MATTADRHGDPNVEHLRQYLRERIEDGDVYFKSKYVAEDLDYSAHQIGALFLKLSKSDTGLKVERWSSSNGTTWRVTQ